jgi:hypothetical protein
MNGRTGGITNNDRDHEQNIFIHPENAKEIVEYLSPHYKYISGEILDACAGYGTLGQAFLNSVCSSSRSWNLDLIEKANGQDILEHKGKKYDIIICNPPWKLKIALPIYNHLLTLLSDNGVLFLLINNVFVYQGADRAKELLYQKYYFLPRYVFKPAGRPLLDCGIMVYHANNKIPYEASLLRPFIPLTRISKEKDNDV